MPFERGRTHLDLAALFHAQGQQETVAIHLSEAHSLFMTLNVPRYIELALKMAEAYGVTLSADRDG